MHNKNHANNNTIRTNKGKVLQCSSFVAINLRLWQLKVVTSFLATLLSLAT